MYKTPIKNILFLSLPIVFFCTEVSLAHKKFDMKNESNNNLDNNSKIKFFENKKLVSSQNDVDENLMKSFDNYPSFEESMKPKNQFKNLFRNTDRELKKSVFTLWKTYEKEMSDQIGNERLNGPDINNTFNDSLNTLSN